MRGGSESYWSELWAAKLVSGIWEKLHAMQLQEFLRAKRAFFFRYYSEKIQWGQWPVSLSPSVSDFKIFIFVYFPLIERQLSFIVTAMFPKLLFIKMLNFT